MLALAIEFSRCPRVRTLKAEQRVLARHPEGRTTSASVINLESPDCLSTCAEPSPARRGAKGSLERRSSTRTFRYGYLVTTSPQSRAPPSTAPSTRVRPPASGVACFRGVTGGVYKARERIHRGNADPRLLATPPSCRRVSACNPNRDAL